MRQNSGSSPVPVEGEEDNQVANKIKFRGAFIRSANISNPDSGDAGMTIHCTADLSETVMEEMNWGVEIQVDDPKDKRKKLSKRVMPEGFDGKYKKTRLLATNVIITPSAGELKKFELDLDAKLVYDFQIVTINDKEGEAASRELRFIIEAGDKDAGSHVWQYVRKLRRERALMTVSYTKQEELDLEPVQADPEVQEELAAQD